MDSDRDGRRINTLDAIFFAIALETALFQMRILEGCKDLKFNTVPSNDNRTTLEIEKLSRDRCLVREILHATMIELIMNEEWHSLEEAVKKIILKTTAPISLRKTYEELQRTRLNIRNDLHKQRHCYSADLKYADEKIAILRDSREDTTVNIKARLSYSEKWLNAKDTINELRMFITKTPPPRTDYENRVHNEIARFYQVETNQREEKIEYWRTRFKEDTAKMNNLLTIKREQLKIAIVKRDELQKLYNLHRGEMNAWLTFKRERAARLAREELSRAAATRIQAWWRGMMVRRGLGQFRFLRQTKKSPVKTKKTK